MKNEKSFEEATPIEKVWEEIFDGTSLDGFTGTSGCHPLPPGVLAQISKLDDRPEAKGRIVRKRSYLWSMAGGR